MTFSIAARSADGTAYGVAVASKFLAVGAAVPAARAGVGAVATQALANLAYRGDALSLLAAGADAQGAVDEVTAADAEREHRQLGVVASDGVGVSWTGSECMPWAGGAVGDGYAIQGNILIGPQVVAAMERAWLDSDRGGELVDRLLASLMAGDRAGGDRRGRQSAALLVVSPDGGYGGGSDVLVDLRVDDHPDPVPELVRLRTLHTLYFERPDPADCVALDAPLATEVAGLLGAVEHAPADSSRAALEAALASWAGMENLEERLVPGRLDPVVLEHLRAARAARAERR
jgi:uncharacterized Ntn-hydrolase superfamily protein